MKQQSKTNNKNKSHTTIQNKSPNTTKDSSKIEDENSKKSEANIQNKPTNSDPISVSRPTPNSMPMDLFLDLMESINSQNDEKTMEICKLSIF
jgi:hypothetical protein